MMCSNFLSFAKMQISALSQIVWLQLLCVVLYPLFFSHINANNDTANVVIYAVGLLMLSYLIIRNFAFNDAKYKTKLLFGILPVMPKTIIGARGAIVYLFCLVATPLLVLFSNIIHLIKPEMFAAVPLRILPCGMLFAAVFLPVEFLIFYAFETQKADIIAALAVFPYMGIMFLMYQFLISGPRWMIVLLIAVFMNVVCYIYSYILYKTKKI